MADPIEQISDVIVEAYQKAQELHSSQCFCFTTASESLRRQAHKTARDGFAELVALLGPLARPRLDAEYQAADAIAKAVQAERRQQRAAVPQAQKE